MTTPHTTAILLRRARENLNAGNPKGAHELARQALSLARKGTSEEFICRDFVAQCLEEQGDNGGALELYKLNAKAGSDQERTYSRLAFLGERAGDLEAVRTGSTWLMKFAGEFGLIDKKEQKRLARVEKQVQQGTFGRKQEASRETTPGPARAGCVALLLALTCAVAAAIGFFGVE